MALHEVAVSPPLLSALAALNCWAVRETDAARLAETLLGKTVFPLLRRGTMRAIIAERKFGAAAVRLPLEFAQLAEQCVKITSDAKADAPLFAAAFFHLRFENIHPLTDGNGRIGRLLLAEQCRRAYGGPIVETLSALHDYEHDYRAVFAAPKPALQYELLVNLLARVLVVPVPSALALPFPLTPVFPERDTRPAANMRGTNPPPKRRTAFGHGAQTGSRIDP